MDKENTIGNAPSGEPEAFMGNASNPTTGATETQGPQGLFDKKADQYIREVAPIEDLPDDEDQQDLEQVIKEEQEAGN